MQTAITLSFADGEYLFRLPIKRIVEIEAKAGPIDAVKYRLLNGGFSVQDVVETIRQGLIGGGKGSVSGVEREVGALLANSLIDAYVDGRPLAEAHILARAIITALYIGYGPETGGSKKKPVKQHSPKSSTGAQSSTTASRSD